MFKQIINNLRVKIKRAHYNDNIRGFKELRKYLNIKNANSKMLDIGCNDGVYTKEYCRWFSVDFDNAYGVDYNDEAVKSLPKDRFYVHDIDSLEKLPFEDKSFDLIVCNQVIEHIKYVDWFFTEANRVLKLDGKLIVSTPNLAAWHNRILLLFGQMPTAIRGMDHHVRGYTIPALSKFAQKYGFRKLKQEGSGFYPFYGKINILCGRLFPQFSTFFTFVLEKKNDFDAREFKEKKFHETKMK